MAIELPRRPPAGGAPVRAVRAPTAENVPQARIARDPGVNVDPDAFGRGAGEATVAAGQAIAGVSDRLAMAAERGQRRLDTVNTARAVSDFRNFGSTELSRMQTEEDFADSATAQTYRTGLQSQIEAIVKSYQGSEDSKAALTGRLLEIEDGFISQAANATVMAQYALVEGTLQSEVNALSTLSYQAPANLAAHMDALERRLGEMGPALTRQQEDAFRSAGRSQIIASGLDSYLVRNDWRSAQEMLDGIPDDFLLPDTRRRYENNINQSQMAETEAMRQGQAKLAEVETILGRPMTAAERARLAGVGAPGLEMSSRAKDLIAAGIMPGTPEFAQIIIAAETKPLAQINNPTQQFGFEAAEKRQSDYITAAGTASSTLVATQRMSNLLASGVQTGKTQPIRTTVRGWLAELGADVNQLDLANAEEFDRQSKQLAVNAVQAFKGAMSEKELDWAAGTVAQLGTSEGGNVKALAAMQAASEIARDNSIALAQAGDLNSFKQAEIDITQRSAEAIIRRAGEIETELRARMALGSEGLAPPTSKDEVSTMSLDDIRRMVEQSSTESWDKLPTEVQDAIAARLKAGK